MEEESIKLDHSYDLLKLGTQLVNMDNYIFKGEQYRAPRSCEEILMFVCLQKKPNSAVILQNSTLLNVLVNDDSLLCNKLQQVRRSVAVDYGLQKIFRSRIV